MKTFSILHLSDLHIEGNSGDPSYKRLRDSLIDDVQKQVVGKEITLDTVVVTGDVVDRGGSDQAYINAKEFINKLLQSIKLTSNNLAIVPGNHDVPRNQFLSGILEKINVCDFSNKQLAKQSWDILESRFKDFYTFQSNITGKEYEPLLFGGSVKDISTASGLVRFFLMNSAWSSCGDTDYEQLRLGRWQLEDMIESCRSLPKPDLAIGLCHHPLKWLNSSERESALELFRSPHGLDIDVLLHGHVHKGSVRSVVDPDSYFVELVSGIGYPNRDKRDIGSSKLAMCRYAIYRFNVDTGLVELWLRISRDDGTFVSDTMQYSEGGENGHFSYRFKQEERHYQEKRASPINVKVDSVPTLSDEVDELTNYVKGNEQENRLMSESIISSPLAMSRNDLKRFKISILICEPLDKSLGYNFGEITKLFCNYDVDINCLHLTEDNLHNLSNDIDYIFVFSKTIKNKLLIEDRYFKSRLITFNELEQYTAIDEVKGVFVFIDNWEQTDKIYGLNIPLCINKYQKDKLSNFIFKALRKADNISLQQDLLYCSANLRLEKCLSGVANIVNYRHPNTSNIDYKNLLNFVGRITELQSIICQIIDLDKRLLTIKGSGGIGKTTIIKKAALELFDRNCFKEGIFLIDCEFIEEYETFEYKLSQCFDIDKSVNFNEHILQNNLHKDSLIILDNFEFIFAKEIFSQIKELLYFLTDYSTVVIVSRELLELEFEVYYELKPFSTDEAEILFKKYYKVRDAKSKNIKLRNILENLLNNNPLAIKIITKNLPKGKNMDELKNELEEDFFKTLEMDLSNILSEPSDRNIEKTKSIFQTINYSYLRLSEKQKLVFEILALFPSGIHISNYKIFLERETRKVH